MTDSEIHNNIITKCINLDWLSIYCIEPNGVVMDAEYYKKLGWIVEYPHCVYITLIRGDKRPNCNLCNNDFYSVCALEDYTRIFSKWLDKKNILKYTKKYEKCITKNSTQRLHKVRYDTRWFMVRKMSWTKACVW